MLEENTLLYYLQQIHLYFASPDLMILDYYLINLRIIEIKK